MNKLFDLKNEKEKKVGDNNNVKNLSVDTTNKFGMNSSNYSNNSMGNGITNPDQMYQQKIQGEIEILEHLGNDCPFINKMLFNFSTDEKLYIGINLMKGGDLFQVLQENITLEENKVIFYAIEIFLAIEFLH